MGFNQRVSKRSNVAYELSKLVLMGFAGIGH